jgi:hypothetical protein
MTAVTWAAYRKSDAMRRLTLSLLLLLALLAGCQQPLVVPSLRTGTPAPLSPTAALAETPAAAPSVAAAPLATSAVTATAAPVLTQPLTTSASLAASWDEWSVYLQALRPHLSAPFAPTVAGLSDMTQYHLAITLTNNLDRLDGEARIRYTNRVTTTLDSVYLHLFPNLWHDGMTISGVRAAGQAVTPKLLSGDSLAQIPLAQPLAPGQSVELALHFSDPIPAGLDVGNYGEFALQNGVLALASFYPTVVVNDGKWHLETPSSIGDVVYARASLYDVSLTAPVTLTVVATGQTAARQDNGNGTVTWRLVGGPMRDFNIVASADYGRLAQQVGDVTVNSYALSQDAAGRGEALSWAVAALGDYQKMFGPYPYRELDVVETPTSAGGIEYPGMIVVAEALYNNPQRRQTFEGATVHEVAHQWWYSVVGDDQVNTPWLDESMAQYSSYLYYQAAYGSAGAQGFMQSLYGRWDSVGRIAMPIGLPVAAYDEQQYSAIVYGRGPLFLIALQDQIGVDKMNAFLQAYYRQYAWRVATPADFESLAEKTSGQDLSKLFAEWVYPAP